MDTDSLITVTNTEFKGHPIKFIFMEEKNDMIFRGHDLENITLKHGQKLNSLLSEQ